MDKLSLEQKFLKSSAISFIVWKTGALAIVWNQQVGC